MGTLTKALVGKEDLKLADDELYPVDTFTRLNYLGGNNTMTKIPDLWKTHYPVINARFYGGSTGALTQATIESALGNIGAVNKRVLVLEPGIWVISSNADWSAYTNITFKIMPGAIISHGAFTVNIPNLAAGLYQVFSGTGTVTLSGVVEAAIPQWFGSAGDATADDTLPIQYAINTGKPVFIPDGRYKITASLTFYKDAGGRALTTQAISGAGPVSTALINAAAASNPTFKDTGTVRGLVLRDMSIIGKTANPNKGLQFKVIESSRVSNVSFDTYGDGVYVTDHAMDVKFDHAYFWWDILSDILGYTSTIRYNSLVQGFSAIKICNGESDGATYWANHVLFDNIWTNGGAYGINSTPKTSYMLRVLNSGLDAWAAADGSTTGHNVPILLENAYRSIVRDCYLNSNAGTAANRLVRLVNCRNVTVENVHDDKYDPTETTSVNTSSIEISGSSTDNIILRDTDCAGAPDIQAGVEAYAAISMENARFTGGFTTANRNAFYMSQFYAKNLYIETEGIAGSGDGYINVSPSTGNPAFLATNGVSSQDNIAVGSAVTVIFGTEVIDATNNFAANTFTAPSGGKYQLSVNLLLVNLDSGATSYETTIRTSNRDYRYIISPAQFTADVTYFTVAFAVLADMDIADTAYVTVEQSGGAQQTDIAANSYFSGILMK